MDINSLEVTIFKALAHPQRIKILKKLWEAELCVCELNDEEQFSQSNMSQHLKILKDADLLIQRKEGLKVFYRVKDERVLQMLEIADAIIKENIKSLETMLK